MTAGRHELRELSRSPISTVNGEPGIAVMLMCDNDVCHLRVNVQIIPEQDVQLYVTAAQAVHEVRNQ